MPKGYKHSDESKRKISEANKGMSAWNKGKHHSAETKKRMSEVHKGNLSNTGKHPSQETRRKISEATKGEKNHNYGNHLSEETKKKLRLSHKNQIRRPHSEEAKRKIGEAQKGVKHHNWKGGITSQNQVIKNSIEYRLWRKAVFVRDNWTCRKCDKKAGGGKRFPLNAHHIKEFAKYPELRFVIDNGITFCIECHKKHEGGV